MKLLVITAIVFGLLRIFLPASGQINQADVFKDLAHVFVGILFGCAGLATHTAFVDLKAEEPRFLLRFLLATLSAWKYWLLAWGLTALEVIAFVVKKSN